MLAWAFEVAQRRATGTGFFFPAETLLRFLDDCAAERPELVPEVQRCFYTGGWDRDENVDPMFRSAEIARALRVSPPATPDLPPGLPAPLIDLYARCDGARVYVDSLELVARSDEPTAFRCECCRCSFVLVLLECERCGALVVELREPLHGRRNLGFSFRLLRPQRLLPFLRYGLVEVDQLLIVTLDLALEYDASLGEELRRRAIAVAVQGMGVKVDHSVDAPLPRWLSP